MNQRAIDVRALAHAYRRLVLWFGVQLLHTAGSGVARAMDIGALATFLVLIGPFVIIATLLAMAFYGYGTAKALGSRVAWLWALAMLIPCANVVSLLAISSKATNACKANGIPVGLLGPSDVPGDPTS